RLRHLSAQVQVHLRHAAPRRACLTLSVRPERGIARSAAPSVRPERGIARSARSARGRSRVEGLVAFRTLPLGAGNDLPRRPRALGPRRPPPRRPRPRRRERTRLALVARRRRASRSAVRRALPRERARQDEARARERRGAVHAPRPRRRPHGHGEWRHGPDRSRARRDVDDHRLQDEPGRRARPLRPPALDLPARGGARSREARRRVSGLLRAVSREHRSRRGPGSIPRGHRAPDCLCCEADRGAGLRDLRTPAFRDVLAVSVRRERRVLSREAALSKDSTREDLMAKSKTVKKGTPTAPATAKRELTGPVFLVLQQGGASDEWYAHTFDTLK